jgi:hypothetical protein
MLDGGYVKRLLAVGGRKRVKPRLAQDHPQRAQDLRLVIADEDPRPVVHATPACAR